jgi:hypothetical protein
MPHLLIHQVSLRLPQNSIAGPIPTFLTGLSKLGTSIASEIREIAFDIFLTRTLDAPSQATWTWR